MIVGLHVYTNQFTEFIFNCTKYEHDPRTTKTEYLKKSMQIVLINVAIEISQRYEK